MAADTSVRIFLSSKSIYISGADTSRPVYIIITENAGFHWR
jgi:hypothetical protein